MKLEKGEKLDLEAIELEIEYENDDSLRKLSSSKNGTMSDLLAKTEEMLQDDFLTLPKAKGS